MRIGPEGVCNVQSTLFGRARVTGGGLAGSLGICCFLLLSMAADMPIFMPKHVERVAEIAPGVIYQIGLLTDRLRRGQSETIRGN